MPDYENGDPLINQMQRRLWALTYECLSKFGCPVMHEYQKRNIPGGTEQTITFYVPRQFLRVQEVKDYIECELADQVLPGISVANTWIPGASVHVLEFSGIDFYMTAAQVNTMVESLSKDFNARLRPH